MKEFPVERTMEEANEKIPPLKFEFLTITLVTVLPNVKLHARDGYILDRLNAKNKPASTSDTHEAVTDDEPNVISVPVRKNAQPEDPCAPMIDELCMTTWLDTAVKTPPVLDELQLTKEEY